MLTDIFAYRYLKHPIWSEYTVVEQRLFNQAFGILKDAIPYYYSNGQEIEANKETWKELHDKIAREIGVNELSTRYYSYNQKNMLGQEFPVSGWHTWMHTCEQFVLRPSPAAVDPDQFLKERLSLIELGIRFCFEKVAKANADLPQALIEATYRDKKVITGLRIPGSAVLSVKAINSTLNSTFTSQVEELNERFRRAGVPLTFHNGFIQVSIDEQVERLIAKPFWNLVANPIWKNVDIDMKEALDRRDSNDKDPAIFASKALESAIKIISDLKNWTTGRETGAAAYVDNLISKANGGYLSPWEGDMLKDYFRKVRNSLGHGPGSEPMPELTLVQTDWAIETAMSWIRTLIRRCNSDTES